MYSVNMCFITLIVGFVVLVLYWLGVLERPRFQVVVSLFGEPTKDDAERKVLVCTPGRRRRLASR